MTKRQIARDWYRGRCLRKKKKKKIPFRKHRGAPICWTKIGRIRITRYGKLWREPEMSLIMLWRGAVYGNNNLHEYGTPCPSGYKAPALFRGAYAGRSTTSGRLCAYAYPHANFYAADLARLRRERQNERSSSSSWTRGGTDGGVTDTGLPVSRTVLRKLAKQAGCQLNICTLLREMAR